MTTERLINSVEIMSFDELDNVAGGTVEEFNDIWAAIEKQAGRGGGVQVSVKATTDTAKTGKVFLTNKYLT